MKARTIRLAWGLTYVEAAMLLWTQLKWMQISNEPMINKLTCSVNN